MYAVGRLGSYITRGVYTVSGPFHPFGGAVDIVVVQQQDGSLKSSPWYVRFGKFQGVLKAKEKIVDINVNGVDADFHMYLDPRGEAYFLREVDSEEVVDAVSSPLSPGEEIDGQVPDKTPVKSKSLDYKFDQCDSVIDVSNGKVLSRNNSKRSRILGFVLGRKSMKEKGLLKEEDDSNIGRIASLERAEIAADLLEMKWSTNISKRNKNKDCREASTDDGEITGGRLEAGLVLHEEHFVNKSESHGVDNELLAKEVDETVVANAIHGGDEKVVEEHGISVEKCASEEEVLRIGLDDSDKPEAGLVTAKEHLEVVAESHSEVASNQQGDASKEVESRSVVAVSVCRPEDDKNTRQVNETNEVRHSLESNVEFQDDSVLTKEMSETFVEEQFSFSDIDLIPSINNTEQGTRTPATSEVNPAGSESTSPKYVSDSSPGRVDLDSFRNDLEGLKGNIRRYPSNVDIPRSCEVTENEFARQAKSLPNMWTQFDDPDPNDYDDSPFYSPVARFRSKWDTLREDASRIVKADLEKGLQLSDSPRAEVLSKDLKDCNLAEGDLPNIVDVSGGSWSLWPFRRSRSNQISQEEQNCKKDSDVDGGLEVDGEKDASSPNSSTMHTRALTPTPEQLASLNLKEGKNTVTFTFSTSVLGSQQVDARIYLWRWDTRIVISDVDGTITKSDVLGQFMPLVGRDWSHIGVAHLFSAIKENGYQLLFLSARAISQAYITRQFLFNLKQDGKALPDGPVVISPDGLFPSLFREVIRRAPHEFKIACLEDIKACFPPDRNPFYAGFGNRDTDEFSYLKVGIPKGKIFIINPKGEVIVNRCIDSKSYTSLHALVNGIFPPISVHEEEDFNSWNFWKLPPPTID